MNYIAKKIALQEKNILNHADLYLDYNNRIAFHKNRKINLTVKEFDILFFLASYPGQVFTHRQIYETVWGKEYFCDEGNVTAHIGHIRKKIELDPRNPLFKIFANIMCPPFIIYLVIMGLFEPPVRTAAL